MGTGVGISVVIIILMPVLFQVILLAGKERQRYEAVMQKLNLLEKKIEKLEEKLNQ